MRVGIGGGARGRTALLLVLAVVAAACDVAVTPSATKAPPAPTDAAPATSAPPSTPSARPSPSPTPASSAGSPVEGDLAGYWRVQEAADAAAPIQLVGSLERRSFAVYRVEPTCGEEPCRSVRVTVLLPSYSATVREYTLTRSGLRYTSADAADAAGATGPCLTRDGTTIPGGATVTERTSLWLEQAAQAGTAVTRTQLRGEIVVSGAPTPTGSAAGCEPWELRYALSGSPTGAPADGGTNPAPTEPPISADLVPRPDIRLTVKGATVDWFSIKGSTVRTMVESVAAGGVRACGRISYEWYQGDTRPSGCMETDWKTFRVAAVPQSGGGCRLDVRRITVAYTIHLPRWTSPAEVPAPLATWWRATVTFIRDHEAGHVAIGQRWVRKLPGLLDGKACSRLQSLMGTWAAGLQQAQEAYDAREYQAEWPPVPAGY
ncbi:MAG TPA: DUF922 domain-containing protein [Candidatus Limnocylindrales bacterium]|nr:DUF922 domain-containing protein [Candidatus Limnocylindrales bacterium]